MGFIDNRKWLGTYHRPLLNVLLQQEEVEELSPVQVEPSRRGGLTVKMEADGKSKYIHSAYAPERDAKRLLSSFREEVSAPVLFIGTGLGYHIDAFVERYPRRRFAIYEPTEALFYQYVKHSKLSTYDSSKVIGIESGGDPTAFINYLMQETKGQLQLIILPYYKEEQPALIEQIQRLVIEKMEDRKVSLATDLAFQQRWTLNATKNFPTLLETPNFLYDVPTEAVEGRVAVIVAAGPSLDHEYDHIRQLLKENKAYVFAVGSAIHSLLAEDIHPHALFSYDPKALNYTVVQKIKDRDLNDIPLIYGSSIGFETIENYPGPMQHFITSQDKLAPELLRAAEDIPLVYDAPSIAVITLQLLLRAGFKKIVFVGQNLGYTGEYRHAKGVSFEGYQPKLTEAEQEEIIYTTDVDGNEIRTKDSFESMKHQLELHIREANDSVEFINTTKGGAHIEGTTYVPMEQLLKEDYFQQVIDWDVWFNRSNPYDSDYTLRQLTTYEQLADQLVGSIEEAMDALKEIARLVQLNRPKLLEQYFGFFDEKYAKVETNFYYRVFIQSMLRVQYDQLTDALAQVRYEDDVLLKGQVIVQAFNRYLNNIDQHHHFIHPHVEEMMERTKDVITNGIDD